ncbi:hypothetical protein MPC4_120056 [Methylocella tundrae]|uniref:Uncharacterized protein n=1 Tax=Methylocella tundrae TaxID=227605 RepID=A0A8B6M1M5_METTU|nr:hypothetical protein MPC1_750006 [Methylocella tundrae]VTZ48931.1 hypothetical protein MPC4_120056 [Methylocella tundrae]
MVNDPLNLGLSALRIGDYQSFEGRKGEPNALRTRENAFEFVTKAPCAVRQRVRLISSNRKVVKGIFDVRV